MDTLDSLTYAGIVLLVLSQIAEKITTFIRNYLAAWTPGLTEEKRRKKGRFRTWFRAKFRHWLNWLLAVSMPRDLQRGNMHEVLPNEQPRVEFAVTKMGLLVGFALAFIFHADLFAMLGSPEPHDLLSWEHGPRFWEKFWDWARHDGRLCEVGVAFLAILKTALGCLCTGFLLTFGSKFFHDLLEILYDIKIAKRNLNDPYTFRGPDLATALQRAASPTGDPVWLALERHKDLLRRKFPKINAIERSVDAQGMSFLDIRLDDAENELNERYRFDYPDPGGDKVLPRSRVRVIPNSPKPVAHTGLTMGMFVNSASTPGRRGTLGFFATPKNSGAGGETVFVTCAHVLGQIPPPKGSAVEVLGWDDKMRKVGTLGDSLLNTWMDAAMVVLDPGFAADNYDPDLETARAARDLAWDERCEVWVNGAVSPAVSGWVKSRENAVEIDYGNGERHTLYNLLAISAPEGKRNPQLPGGALSQPGDSGAVVFDRNMDIVGMIVAGNGETSYALPIGRILNHFQLEITPGEMPS